LTSEIAKLLTKFYAKMVLLFVTSVRCAAKKVHAYNDNSPTVDYISY